MALNNRLLLTLSLLLIPVLPIQDCRAAEGDLYSQALEKYRQGDFAAVVTLLSQKKSKNSGDNNLLGWAYLKSGKAEAAIAQFRSSVAKDPSAYNSYCGIGYAKYQQGSFAEALKDFEKGAAHDPECAAGKRAALEKIDGKTPSAAPEVRAASARPGELPAALARADALRKGGDNLGAARVYAAAIDGGIDNGVATDRLLAMYGWERYTSGQKLEPPVRQRPAELSWRARAKGDYLEVLEDGSWKVMYVKGVNIGPARPGEFPSTPPQDVKTYLGWLKDIAAMNCNTVRMYTILPPAFYQALKIHNDSSAKKLWILQEVWLTEHEDPNDKDLYDRAWTQDFRGEIRDNIRVLHGEADIPLRPGHASGIYTADVSPYVLGLGVGRELEPSVALTTNGKHPDRTSYQGRYISGQGNPTEVWFAEQSDYAATLAMDRYNVQHPITLVNWPPLDPMHHITEANYYEELALRTKRGEKVQEAAAGIMDDADAVSVDVNAFKVSSAFLPKVFASFHCYTHWPNFLFTDPDYPKTRDAEGSNRYLGYLLDLKSHYKTMPLLVAEYGIATSWGTAHLHPDGWGNGGQSENEQAKILKRMTSNIRDARCAGGIIFAWQDEWWKRVSDYFTRAFSMDLESKPLWLNLYDPEEMFGIQGFRSPPPVPLLRGKDADWQKAAVLASSSAGSLRALRVMSDSTFLYFRVDVDKAEAPFGSSEFVLLLNTFPGGAGMRKIPGLGLTMEPGANFMIRLSSASGRIEIAENYNPNEWLITYAGRELWRKPKMEAKLEDESVFGDIVTETNTPHWSRDGTLYKPQFASRSSLRKGTADPDSPKRHNQSAWNYDEKKGMLEVRIPWGLLYFTNPAGRQVFAGNEKGEPFGKETPGVAVAALRVEPGAGGGMRVSSSLPAGPQGRMSSESVPVYKWNKWVAVEYESFLKPSYYVMKDVFATLDAPK